MNPITEEIKDFVNNFYGVDISSRSRKEPLPTYRKFFWLLCYKYDRRSRTKEMGMFTNRHHSTVVVGIQSISGLLEVDRNVIKMYDEIEEVFLKKYPIKKGYKMRQKELQDHSKLQLTRNVDILRRRLKTSGNVKRNALSKLESLERILEAKNEEIKSLKDTVKALRNRNDQSRHQLNKIKGIEVKLEKVG